MSPTAAINIIPADPRDWRADGVAAVLHPLGVHVTIDRSSSRLADRVDHTDATLTVVFGDSFPSPSGALLDAVAGVVRPDLVGNLAYPRMLGDHIAARGAGGDRPEGEQTPPITRSIHSDVLLGTNGALGRVWKCNDQTVAILPGEDSALPFLARRVRDLPVTRGLVDRPIRTLWGPSHDSLLNAAREHAPRRDLLGLYRRVDVDADWGGAEATLWLDEPVGSAYADSIFTTKLVSRAREITLTPPSVLIGELLTDRTIEVVDTVTLGDLARHLAMSDYRVKVLPATPRMASRLTADLSLWVTRRRETEEIVLEIFRPGTSTSQRQLTLPSGLVEADRRAYVIAAAMRHLVSFLLAADR